jgi:hypothetical protein
VNFTFILSFKYVLANYFKGKVLNFFTTPSSSASRLRNITIHPNSYLKVEVKYVEGETLCLKVDM